LTALIFGSHYFEKNGSSKSFFEIDESRSLLFNLCKWYASGGLPCGVLRGA